MELVTTIVTGRTKSNAYIISDGNSIAVIDPGNDAQLIADQIHSRSSTPHVSILLTHGHVDQIQCVPRLVRLFPQATVHSGRAESLFLYDPQVNLSRHTGTPVTFVEISSNLTNVVTGNFINVGKYEVKVVETPGHTPGSVMYLLEAQGIAFCGDTILKGSTGGSNLPFGDENRLFTSIRDRVLTMPDEMILLPAHGPATTVGAEKKNNLWVQTLTAD
jgi:glyoxylase-like metal-dependent hydrolase (beta-lactamase superfamily II)